MATPAKKMDRSERWRAPDPPPATPLHPVGPSEPTLLQPPRRHRRIYLLSFLVSAALHVLAVLVYPLLVERGGAPPRPGAPVGTPRPQGTEVVVIREVPDAPTAEPEPAASPARQPESVPPPVTAPPVSAGPPTGAAEPGAAGAAAVGAAGAAEPSGAGGARPAERLRPGLPDLRLWTMDPQFTRLTEEQIVKLELLWTIIDMNASAAAAAAAARALTDWTYTDEAGKRWGFADGKVYLGDVVLPFPFAFGAPPNSAAAERAWIDAEIDRAAGSAAARANLNQRIKAIRERLEQERRRIRADSVRTPPKP
jgi:hypothetical protein